MESVSLPASTLGLGLLNLIDGVETIFIKLVTGDPLNHEHEIRGIGQPLSPIVHGISQLIHMKQGTLNLSPPGANLASTFLTYPLRSKVAPSLGFIVCLIRLFKM